jgi:hypothetical protein
MLAVLTRTGWSMFTKACDVCSGHAAVNPAALPNMNALKPNWLLCSLNEPDMSGAAVLTAYGKWMSNQATWWETASVKGWCGLSGAKGAIT